MTVFIKSVYAGKEKLLGVWSTGTNGKNGDLYSIANAGRSAIDGLEMASQTIKADARRSAKKDDIREAARFRLKQIAQAQHELNKRKAQAKEEMMQFLSVPAYRDGDASTVQIDLALAQLVRSMSISERTALALSGNDDRLIEACLRLPTALTGLTENLKQKMIAEAGQRKDPNKAQELEDYDQGLQETQECLNRSWKFIADTAGFDFQEQIESGGNDDLMPGWPEGMVERAIEKKEQDEKDETKKDEDEKTKQPD